MVVREQLALRWTSGVGGASLPGTPPPRSWSPVAGHGLGGGGGDGASVATLPPSHAGSRTVSVWGVAVIAFFLTGAGPYGAEVGAWGAGRGRAGGRNDCIHIRLTTLLFARDPNTGVAAAGPLVYIVACLLMCIVW